MYLKKYLLDNKIGRWICASVAAMIITYYLLLYVFWFKLHSLFVNLSLTLNQHFFFNIYINIFHLFQSLAESSNHPKAVRYQFSVAFIFYLKGTSNSNYTYEEEY